MRVGSQPETLAIATKSLVVLLLAALGGLGFLGYSEFQFTKHADRLDADLAAFRRLRWERPLLRGEPVDGNAAEAIFGAISRLDPPSEALRKGLAEQLFYGQPLLPHQAKVLDRQREGLSALRHSTQHTWSMTHLRPELGAQMPVPDYERALDAVLLLLAHASTLSADDCLAVCADAVRIGQDMVPGAPLEAVSTAMRIASLAEPLVRHCAKRATPEAVRGAVRDFRTLASHPAPTGHALVLMDLVHASALRLAGQLPPGADHLLVVRQLQARRGLIDAWRFFEDPHRFREIVPENYPDALNRWHKEEAWRNQSGIGIVATSTTGVTGYLFDDMRGQAIVRALAVGLSAISEQHLRGRLPEAPPALKEPALRDPFTGHALLFKLDDKSYELSVWSLGEDMRDGGGRETWSDKAPLDVVAHLRLPTPEPRKRRTSRGR